VGRSGVVHDSNIGGGEVERVPAEDSVLEVAVCDIVGRSSDESLTRRCWNRWEERIRDGCRRGKSRQ
jgi:hypothetical protein